MGKRLLAAFIGLAVLIPALLFGGVIAAEIILGLAMLVCLDEYATMAFPEQRFKHLFVLLVPSLGLFFSVLHGSQMSVVGTLILGSFWFLGAILFRPEPVETAANATARLFLGWVYVPMLMVFPVLLRQQEDGLAWVFLLLAVTWLGDTGAYFAGRFLGKRKLYEKISPKKTWEGAIGGAVTATLGVCAVKAIAMEFDALVGLAWWECVLIGVVIDSIGVCGDLVESMLKRSFGVKDSGWIMPGHGGLLDRVDALLLTGPALWLYVMAVRPLLS